MGKTTRIHPVSLPILREAARACGFLLWRIHQEELSGDEQTARYAVEIRQAPVPFGGVALEKLKIDLNMCFSTDIQVARCWKTRSDKIYAEILTTINVFNADRNPADWLTPLNNEELFAELDKMALDLPEDEVDRLSDGQITDEEEI